MTRNPRPVIPPDAASLVSVVNFTVTKSGLEGQLLGVTIQFEKPELEKQKSEMLRREENFKVQLADLETNLLSELALSSGNLLENTQLIESLTKTKVKAAEIEVALQESTEMSLELNRQRDAYKPFAKTGARLYFLTQSLRMKNHMYQFSLRAFTKLFRGALESNSSNNDEDETEVAVESKNRASLKRHLRTLSRALEQSVLLHVSRSLFKADRLMWALQLVRGMHPEEIDEEEWAFFLGASSKTTTSNEDDDNDDNNNESKESKRSSSSVPDWIPSERKLAYRNLIKSFPDTASELHLLENDTWQQWVRSASCERSFPRKVAATIRPVQKLLLVQAVRPDRMQTAMDIFVCDILHIASVSPPPAKYEDLYKLETSSKTQVLFITSTGADPSDGLRRVAAETVGRENYHEVSMGGGQQERALKLLRKCAESGAWLCLQNLHLVVAWLPTLEKELNSLTPHESFRLWLTTEPHNEFPTILICQSLKITVEAPPGIKKNLQRTYGSMWTPEFVERGSKRRAQVLFMLSWFHALLQERRNFIPQGWSKFYEFSTGDLRASTAVVDMIMARRDNNEEDTWPAIHGLIENALYVFFFIFMTLIVSLVFFSLCLSPSIQPHNPIQLNTIFFQQNSDTVAASQTYLT